MKSHGSYGVYVAINRIYVAVIGCTWQPSVSATYIMYDPVTATWTPSLLQGSGMWQLQDLCGKYNNKDL